MTVDDKTSLEPLIGPPIRYGFSTYLGLAEPSLSVAVAAFRDYLGTKGVLEYQPYDGIVELLDDLLDDGATLALVTSKSLPFVELIIDHLEMKIDFAAVVAGSLGASPSEKVALVEQALRELTRTRRGRGHDRRPRVRHPRRESQRRAIDRRAVGLRPAW